MYYNIIDNYHQIYLNVFVFNASCLSTNPFIELTAEHIIHNVVVKLIFIIYNIIFYLNSMAMSRYVIQNIIILT